MHNTETKILAIFSLFLSILSILFLSILFRKFELPKPKRLSNSILGGFISLLWSIISWALINFAFNNGNGNTEIRRFVVEWFNGQGKISTNLGFFVGSIFHLPLWASAFTIAFIFGFLSALLIDVGLEFSKSGKSTFSKSFLPIFLLGLGVIIFSFGIYFTICKEATTLLMYLA